MYKNLEKVRQFFAVASHSRTLSLIVILLIVAAVPLTVFVAQKQQEIRQRAEMIQDCECMDGKWGGFYCHDQMVDKPCSNDPAKTGGGVSYNTPSPTPKSGGGTVGTGGSGGVKCEDDGIEYNPGDKRWECTSPKTKGPCAEDAGVGVPFVCENDANWRNVNPYGECTTECKPDASIKQCNDRGLDSGACGNRKPSETCPADTPHSDSEYIWRAHCDKSCVDTEQGVKVCPNSMGYDWSSWCYGFNGGGTKRCLELQQISAGQPTPTPTPGGGIGGTTACSGNACTDCILNKRTDLLKFYKNSGWDTACSNQTRIVDNWCSDIDASSCNSIKNGDCRSQCQTSEPGDGESAPSCDASQVQMSSSPSSPKVSERIAFNVAGSQGSTYVNDVWSPDGGVDCIGGFWGKKECKAKKEGTYTWTHKWKNCAPNNCGVTSSECSKSVSFTIAANPTPTPASCPALTASDAPSELKYTCDTANKKINISWKAPSNTNVTSYSIRVDKNPTSWNGNCSSPSSGDSCADPTSTSYTIENIDPNVSYRVWIHSRDKCGNWSPIVGTKAEMTFSCKPLSLNLQAWWIDGTDWTPITPRIELIVRDYVLDGEKVCVPEGEKNNIEIYNSETGGKVGLLKDYQTIPLVVPPGKRDYNCGAYQDWGKHTAFRLFGTKQQLKGKGLPNKIKFKIPNFTNMSNEVELASTTPAPTTPPCSIFNGPCGWGITGQLLGVCCTGLRCESYPDDPDGGICKIASAVRPNPDVDRDGCIGQKDVELWLRAYQKTDQPPYSCPSGYICKENEKYYPDINNDNKIDLLDFSEWVSAMIEKMIKEEKPCQ